MIEEERGPPTPELETAERINDLKLSYRSWNDQETIYDFAFFAALLLQPIAKLRRRWLEGGGSRLESRGLPYGKKKSNSEFLLKQTRPTS